MRELLSHGTLFANMDLLFGPAAANMEFKIFDEFPGVLLAALPPGAFIALGLIIALKNYINRQYELREIARKGAPVAGSKRIRTTGTIS